LRAENGQVRRLDRAESARGGITRVFGQVVPADIEDARNSALGPSLDQGRKRLVNGSSQ
jgi:hypothetical protein